MRDFSLCSQRLHDSRRMAGILLCVFLMANGLLTASSLSLLAADDWTDFRGSARDGKITGKQLPLTWSQDEALKWRVELPGQGWSSPIVVQDRIYLTTAIEGAQGGYDLALLIVSATGELEKRAVLFQQGTDAPRIHKKNSHASPTPIYDGQSLYVHFGHQGTACVDLDGQVLWTRDDLGFPPVHGNGGTPMVVGENLVFSRDGADISQILALDRKRGTTAWELEREVEASKRFSFCTPLLLDQAGRKQMIFPGSNVVQSLDPDSGREIWRLEYDGYSVIPRPIFESGLVFVCTGYNRPSLLAIDPSGSGNVTETHLKWSTKSNVPHTPSLIGYQGTIAMVSDRGIATCLDAKTGEEIWKQRIGGNFSASPVLVGKRLYLLSEDGVCTVLNVENGEEIATNEIGERCLSSMAVIGNDWLLRSETALYRISSN